MKVRNLLIQGACLATLVAGIAACNDDIHDFSKKTASDETVDIYIADEDMEFPYSLLWNADTVLTGADSVWIKFPVYLASPVESDVNVTVIMDNNMIEPYNVVHGTTYRAIPATGTKLGVKIPMGEIRSEDSVTISIPNIKVLQDTNGYLIPIRIHTFTGTGVALDYAERTSYLVIDVRKENGIYLTTKEVSMFNIPGKDLWADLGTVTLNLASYLKVSDETKVTVSVRNDLIADLNASMGTDYQSVPEGDLTQSYEVDFAQGQSIGSFALAYSGDKTSLSDTRGYLIPLEITSVEGENINSVTARKNFLVRLDVGTVWCDLVGAPEVISGTEITDRSGYNVVKFSIAKPTYGQYNNMFNDDASSFWYTQAETSITIDLGEEVSDITGLHLRTFTSGDYVSRVNVAYATAEMYAAGQERPLGGVTISSYQEHIYIEFSEPVTGRYISLNNMIAGEKGLTFLSKFYLYTQP